MSEATTRVGAPKAVVDGAGLLRLFERHHTVRHPDMGRTTCPVCQDDLQKVGITALVYTFEVCKCGRPSYDHLVEQLWHRVCFRRGPLPAPGGAG